MNDDQIAGYLKLNRSLIESEAERGDELSQQILDWVDWDTSLIGGRWTSVILAGLVSDHLARREAQKKQCFSSVLQ